MIPLAARESEKEQRRCECGGGSVVAAKNFDIFSLIHFIQSIKNDRHNKQTHKPTTQPCDSNNHDMNA